jgi:hypothetical protein
MTFAGAKTCTCAQPVAMPSDGATFNFLPIAQRLGFHA